LIYNHSHLNNLPTPPSHVLRDQGINSLKNLESHSFKNWVSSEQMSALSGVFAGLFIGMLANCYTNGSFQHKNTLYCGERSHHQTLTQMMALDVTVSLGAILLAVFNRSSSEQPSINLIQKKIAKMCYVPLSLLLPHIICARSYIWMKTNNPPSAPMLSGSSLICIALAFYKKDVLEFLSKEESSCLFAAYMTYVVGRGVLDFYKMSHTAGSCHSPVEILYTVIASGALEYLVWRVSKTIREAI
jgi:hypothetical protein